MRRQTLQVTMHVHEPSVVELTIEDHVQLDQLTASPRGYVAERHGALLRPGVATLALGRGFYFFKTLSNANLKIVCGGIDVVTNGGSECIPSPEEADRGRWLPVVPSRGDPGAGEPPMFTLSQQRRRDCDCDLSSMP
jgi:hypothetical protein